MRLHTLTMEAFGPFAEQTHVDFDALGTDGLFLLHGHTGAGKTSVLDAVAFALFGRVPGARDTDRRLHSDHSPPGSRPSVTLEATVSGRRMRITRSPEHVRPKRRGAGTVKVSAAATLVWVDGSGPDLTRLPEIGDQVNRLLGMSADQFFQVVLLPQNEFARFLRAETEARETLLERLFDTQRFADVEEWLRDRARTSRSRLDEHRARIDRVAGQIVAVGGGVEPVDPDPDWAADRLSAVRDEYTGAATELKHEQHAVIAADHALVHAERVCALRTRHDAAVQRLHELDRGAAILNAARDAVAAARAAAPIVPLLDADTAAERQATETAAAQTDAEAALRDDSVGVELMTHLHCPPTARDRERIDSAIATWSAEAGRLRPLAERAQHRSSMVDELRDLATATAESARRTAAIDVIVSDAPAQRARIESDLVAVARHEAAVPGLNRDIADLRRAEHALDECERLDVAIRRGQDEVRSATDHHLAARERLANVREQRIVGMAAELARGLTDGHPCPVCGSDRHPEPADHDDTTTTEVSLAAAEKSAVAAEQRGAAASNVAREHVTELLSRRSHLEALVGERSRDDVARDVQHVTARLTAAPDAVTAGEHQRSRLAELDAHLAQLRVEASELAVAQTRWHERAEVIRRDLTELDREVAMATGGTGDVEAHQRILTERCRRIGLLRDARSAASEAADRWTDTRGRLDRAMTTAGFPDRAAVRKSTADDVQITEWEVSIARSESIRAHAVAEIGDPAVAAAVREEPVDVDVCTVAAHEAHERRDCADRRRAVAARRLTDVERLVAQYVGMCDALEPMVRRDAELAGLAETVVGRGANRRRMSLRSYVVAARLEEVVAAGSVRLREMSSGRYEFAHSDAAGARGRRGGLGIEVRDEYTGVVRPVSSLSGGETFFAALALALGLADVVSAESGGRLLDTMFIDEGFGSLDPETLDRVVGVLDDLRAGGRVVGVVSHVDEMRARIPAQLQVIRSETGSRVRVSGVPA